MLDLSVIKELSDEEKKWLASAVVGAAVADHVIVNTEVRYVQEVLEHLDSDNKMGLLLDLMKRKEMPELPKLHIKRLHAAKIFVYLAQVTIIDNKLSESEVKFLQHIGQNLGFGDEEIHLVVNWAYEIALLAKKEEELIEILGKESEHPRFSMKDPAQ